MGNEAVVDKAGASPATSSGPSSGAVSTGVTSSGTASEALLKAVSSMEGDNNSSAEPAAKVSGDTSASSEPKATVTNDEPATGVAKPTGQAEKPAANADALPEARAVAITKNARQQLGLYLGKEIGLLNDFGEARAIMPQDLPTLKAGYELVQDLRRDAVSFFFELGDRLGYQFPNGEEEPPQAWTPPKAELRSEDGREAYSAGQVTEILSNFEKRLRAEFQGQLQPLQSFQEASQTVTQKAEAKAAADSMAAGVLGQARQLQYFKENEPLIAARIRQYHPSVRQQLGAVGTLYRAYNEILNEKVYPSINASAEQRVRDENAKKAAGSAIVHPSGAHGEAKKPELRDGDVNGLAAHMERMFAST